MNTYTVATWEHYLLTCDCQSFSCERNIANGIM